MQGFVSTSSCFNMAFARTVLVVTAFGVLCSISIYWNTLDRIYINLQQTQVLLNNERIPFKTQWEFEPNITQLASLYQNYRNETNIKIAPLNTNKSEPIAQKRQIWISMGLCFSKNTDMYGKEKYPYTQVTPLAIILWYHFFPDIRIILYLIYDKNEIEDRRKLYEEQLKQTNVEIRWVKAGDMSCVTKSQVIRMWAFQEPLINDNDIIITVDVNLFVVTNKILDPIYQNPSLKLWVFQWHNTAFGENGIGDTFNQNLISAESKGDYPAYINKQCFSTMFYNLI